MMLLKNRLVNSMVVSIISLLYGALFMLISGHVEFISILPKGRANYDFWEGWCKFLLVGNIKYIGIVTILIGLIILARTILTIIKYRRVKLDEYEVSLLQRGLSVAGITAILLIPILLILILSEPQYAVPFALFFVVVTWSAFALTSLYFVFRL